MPPGGGGRPGAYPPRRRANRSGRPRSVAARVHLENASVAEPGGPTTDRDAVPAPPNAGRDRASSAVRGHSVPRWFSPQEWVGTEVTDAGGGTCPHNGVDHTPIRTAMPRP